MKLLQVTALLYLIPFMQSFYQDDQVFQWGLGAVVLTSLVHHQRIQHTQVAQSIRTVDMAIAHFMIVYHVYKAVITGLTTWRVLTMYLAIIYSGSIYWCTSMCHVNDNWHATIHVTTALGSYLFLKEMDLV
jgi:hypothetical protein